MAQVFISYAREDEPIAVRLDGDLKGHHFRTWIDRAMLFGGDLFREKIATAIRRSTHFVPLLSDRSLGKDRYIRTEIREALECCRVVPGRRFVIPVRVDDSKHNDPELNEYLCISLHPEYEEGFESLLSSIRDAASGAAGVIGPQTVADELRLDWKTPFRAVKKYNAFICDRTGAEKIELVLKRREHPPALPTDVKEADDEFDDTLKQFAADCYRGAGAIEGHFSALAIVQKNTNSKDSNPLEDARQALERYADAVGKLVELRDIILLGRTLKRVKSHFRYQQAREALREFESCIRPAIKQNERDLRMRPLRRVA